MCWDRKGTGSPTGKMVLSGEREHPCSSLGRKGVRGKLVKSCVGEHTCVRMNNWSLWDWAQEGTCGEVHRACE